MEPKRPMFSSVWPRAFRFLAPVVILCLTTLPAFSFNYAPKDLLLCFRQPGGSYELEVNLGPATNLWNLQPGKAILVTNFSQVTLQYAFSDLSGLYWSAISSVGGQYADANQPTNTCWVTRPRSDINVQSVPWQGRTVSQMGMLALAIGSVGANAMSYSANKPLDGVINSNTSLIISAGNVDSYSVQVGPSGNFKGKFWADPIECQTPLDFVTAGRVVRADLYEVRPSSVGWPAIYRGYFELSSDGAITYTAAAPVVPPPAPDNLQAFWWSGGVGLSWNSSPGATYYDVKRATTNGEPYTVLASNLINLTYTDVYVTNGVTYKYVVSAIDSAGEGANSDPIFVTPRDAPDAPGGLQGVAGNASVTLSWNASLWADNYNVKRSLTDGGPYDYLTNITNTTYTDGMVTNGITYYYVVSAVNPGGEGVDSTQVFATPTVGGLPPAHPSLGVSYSTTSGTTQIAISFPSEIGVNYTLCATNQTGLTQPLSQWPAVMPVLTGTGAVLSFTVNLDSSNMFYSIKAARP